MRKFLILVVKSLALILCAVVILNSIYVQTNRQLISGNYLSVPYDIEICNLGSSHGGNFAYDEFTDRFTCYNFSLSEQTLSYDYRMLQNFSEHLSPGCTIFVIISPFSFYGVSEDSTAYFESKNQRYYQILDKKYIKKYDYKIDFLLNKMPLLTVDLGAICTQVVNKIIHSQNSQASNNVSYNSGIDYDTAYTTATKLYNNYVSSRQTNDGHMVENKEECESLLLILDYCESHGYNPVMITTPFLNEYNDMVQENSKLWAQDFYSKISQAAKLYDVPYFDYSRDDEFSAEYSLFNDAAHLNSNGARLFTKRVILDSIEY